MSLTDWFRMQLSKSFDAEYYRLAATLRGRSC